MQAGTRPDGTDAFAEALFDEHHWDLRVVIAVTVEGEKEVASTDGMNLTERTSPYYPAWIETVEPDVQSAITAIAARDFDHLARIAEASALRMHASAIAADPGVLYWRGATVEVIHEVRRLRAGGLPVFFTIDAGPHVKVFTPTDEVAAVVRALEATPGVLRTIVTAPAAGAHLVHG
jgi:diphosphomevalonate decarboxylase